MIMHLFWVIEPPRQLHMNCFWFKCNLLTISTCTHIHTLARYWTDADLHSSCDNNWCHLLCRNFHKRLPKAKLNEISSISFFKVLWMRPVHVTPFPAAGVWYVTAPLSAGTWQWEIWDSRKVVVTTSPGLPKTERIRWVTSVCAHSLSENRWRVFSPDFCLHIPLSTDGW